MDEEKADPAQEQPPVPESGWHPVAESGEVTADSLHSFDFGGSEFVSYRDKSGRVHIASAKCPHNGIDLNCTNAPIQDGIIACPLHGWNFDTASGKCTLIPYNPAKLPDISLAEYPARERSGGVELWWD